VTRKHLGALALVVFSVLHWHVAAAGPTTACEPDRKKLCADVEFGGGRVLACLQQHKSELSDACKQQLADASEKGATKPECRADAAKFCSPAIGDRAKMETCMQEHAAQLSDGCKAALNAQGK